MSSVRAFCIHLILKIIPPTRFYALKRAMFRWAGINVDSGVMIVSSTRTMVTGSVSIGRDTFVGHECLVIGGDAPIQIGANVDIGPRVTLVTGTHHIQYGGSRVAGDGYSLPITIGEGCWIGAGVIILGGTTIGTMSIVAAGAVVKGNFPSNCLIGGVPAKILRDTLNQSK